MPEGRLLEAAKRFCPHCSAHVAGPPAEHAMRCPTCRLVIGAGRLRAAPDPYASNAGFMANAAHREGAEAVGHSVAFRALRRVARATGCPVERLRMTDYAQAVHAGLDGPSVAAILATFDTWKRARAAARPGAPRFARAATRQARG